MILNLEVLINHVTKSRIQKGKDFGIKLFKIYCLSQRKNNVATLKYKQNVEN